MAARYCGIMRRWFGAGNGVSALACRRLGVMPGSQRIAEARQLSVISSHALGAVLATVVLGGYFAINGIWGVGAVAALASFIAPLGIAAYLARSGRLGVAHLLSSVQLTALVVLVAIYSGGSQSYAMGWLALVPLEAALSGRPRIAAAATCIALAAGAALGVSSITHVLPETTGHALDGAWIATAAQLAAVAYAGAVAASVVRIQLGSQRELEAGREQFRLIAENTNDLITRHDADGRIIFASLASTTILGAPPDRLVACGLESVLHEADRQRFRASIARCLAFSLPVAEEYRIERSSEHGGAEPGWIEMRCQSVRASTGAEAPSVVVVTRDITRRKSDMAALEAARNEAERSSRAKTVFLAVMSHELRTPLSSIIGFAELMHVQLKRGGGNPKHVEYCQVIQRSGEHLLSLVRDLLDVSRIESGKFAISPEALSLADLVDDVAGTLQPDLRAKDIRLTVEVDAGLPDLFSDRRGTRQILFNLVSNAIKFTPAGGKISIAAHRAGAMAAIEVCDSGVGIAAEHLSQLGRPFYQADSSYARRSEGAGLGLSIVRGLAELHGGSLEIESELGNGARFTVRLPLDLGAQAGAIDTMADSEGALLLTA